MSRRKKRFTSATYDYTRFGNERPPVDHLLGVITKANTYSTPMGQLIAAQAHIDLAVHQHNARVNLDSAYGNLAAILEQQKSRNIQEPEKSLTIVAVSAVLHMAMLERWGAVIFGKTIKDDYLQLLNASRQTIEFMAQEQVPKYVEIAEVGLMESTPLLLGARKAYREKAGWVGRLALWREDHGLQTSNNFNPNWDVGLCFEDRQENFIDPMKIQVQKTHLKGALASQAAGIRLISAAKMGFNNPQQVVLSCLNEFEAVKEPSGITLLSSEQLDKITHNLETEILEQLPS